MSETGAVRMQREDRPEGCVCAPGCLSDFNLWECNCGCKWRFHRLGGQKIVVNLYSDVVNVYSEHK